jgi:hypothetical protein
VARYNLTDELYALIDAFEREHIAYAVCGGLALALHGYPRTTLDLDVLVLPDQVADASRIARELGFDVPARKMIFGLRTNTPREMQRVSKLDSSGEMLSLDLIVVADDLQGIWDERVDIDTGSRVVVAVSRDGLIAMKRIAGRPKDLLDIMTMEGTADDEPA